MEEGQKGGRTPRCVHREHQMRVLLLRANTRIMHPSQDRDGQQQQLLADNLASMLLVSQLTNSLAMADY